MLVRKTLLVKPIFLGLTLWASTAAYAQGPSAPSSDLSNLPNRVKTMLQRAGFDPSQLVLSPSNTKDHLMNGVYHFANFGIGLNNIAAALHISEKLDQIPRKEFATFYTVTFNSPKSQIPFKCDAEVEPLANAVRILSCNQAPLQKTWSQLSGSLDSNYDTGVDARVRSASDKVYMISDNTVDPAHSGGVLVAPAGN